MQLLLLCVLQLYLFKLFTNVKKEKKIIKKKKSLMCQALYPNCAVCSGVCSLFFAMTHAGEITRKLNSSLSTGFKREGKKKKRKINLYLFILYWSWLCCISAAFCFFNKLFSSHSPWRARVPRWCSRGGSLPTLLGRSSPFPPPPLLLPRPPLRHQGGHLGTVPRHPGKVPPPASSSSLPPHSCRGESFPRWSLR